MKRQRTSLKGEACFIATWSLKALSRRAGSVFSIFFWALAGAFAWGAAATRPARTTAATARARTERWVRRMENLLMIMARG